jgi:hypothetical protein
VDRSAINHGDSFWGRINGDWYEIEQIEAILSPPANNYYGTNPVVVRVLGDCPAKSIFATREVELYRLKTGSYRHPPVRSLLPSDTEGRATLGRMFM